jgi:uncharacterized protein YdeI (YjbR/CyaY-like superfamily)
MPGLDDYPQVAVTSRSALRSWLGEHHARSSGVWLVTFKKGRGPHVPYDEAVEELLCVGWIDSKPRKLDADRTMLLATPRKPKSAWSKLNKDRVARLLAANQMRPSGMQAVTEAKKNGRWSALDGVEALEIPPDLRVALRAVSDAEANFEAFPRSAKRGILEWILQAKKPETRARRVTETARLAGQNQRANQWPR